jgi:hypothetical protein
MEDLEIKRVRVVTKGGILARTADALSRVVCVVKVVCAWKERMVS